MAAWVDVVRGSVREVYSYASLLAGRDAEAAEGLVRTAYATLAEARRQGAEVDAVGKALRRVVRRRWVEHLAEVPPARKAQRGESRVLADLPAHVRTIVVLKAIDGMPSARVGRETGVPEADVDRLYEQARAWLGEQGADTEREWVRARIGDLPVVPPVLVEQLVTEFQPGAERADGSPVVATYAVGVGELDATPPRGRDSHAVDPSADVPRPDAQVAEGSADADEADADPGAEEPDVEPAATGGHEVRRRRGLRRILVRH